MKQKKLISSNEEILFFHQPKWKTLSHCEANIELCSRLSLSPSLRLDQTGEFEPTCTFMLTYVQFAWLRTHYKNASDYYDDDHILWQQHCIILAMAFSCWKCWLPTKNHRQSIRAMRAHFYMVWCRHRKFMLFANGIRIPKSYRTIVNDIDS